MERKFVFTESDINSLLDLVMIYGTTNCYEGANIDASVHSSFGDYKKIVDFIYDPSHIDR